MKTNETRTISTPKRMAAAFLALLTLLFAIPLDGVGITAWANATYTTSDGNEYTINGDGTSGSPYLIYNADDLIVFSNLVNDGSIGDNMDAKLMKDIDFDTDSELGGGIW
jgi:hypothetical protein